MPFTPLVSNHVAAHKCARIPRLHLSRAESGELSRFEAIIFQFAPNGLDIVLVTVVGGVISAVSVVTDGISSLFLPSFHFAFHFLLFNELRC